MSTFPIGLKRAATLIILCCEHQLLLLKRNKAPNAGRYVPVGGKLEPHEDPYTAALRETYEETGLQLASLQYAGTMVETSPVNYNWWTNIYWAEIPWQIPPPCDEGVLTWIDFTALATTPGPATGQHLYSYFLRRQAFAFNAVYDPDLQLISLIEEIEGLRLV